jgi:hypothetical protein
VRAAGAAARTLGLAPELGEIDEILALRILTMTEDEKSEMRNTDDRARKILERTENLPIEHLMKLHGTLRELRRELRPEFRSLGEEMS